MSRGLGLWWGGFRVAALLIGLAAMLLGAPAGHAQARDCTNSGSDKVKQYLVAVLCGATPVDGFDTVWLPSGQRSGVRLPSRASDGPNRHSAYWIDEEVGADAVVGLLLREEELAEAVAAVADVQQPKEESERSTSILEALRMRQTVEGALRGAANGAPEDADAEECQIFRVRGTGPGSILTALSPSSGRSDPRT